MLRGGLGCGYLPPGSLPELRQLLRGRDPNVQLIRVKDAARALVAAVESDATGSLTPREKGLFPLKNAFRAAGRVRLPGPKFLQRPDILDLKTQPNASILQYPECCKLRR